MTDVLVRSLKAKERRNARSAHELYKLFAKAVKPLLEVHLTAAQQALGPSSGPGNPPLLPLAAPGSCADTSTDSSGSAYAIADSSVGEGNVLGEWIRFQEKQLGCQI